MMILAIDTAALNCSVALLRDGEILASDVQNIGKGHAEILTSQIDTLCHKADISLQSINKIAVNVGPGSFTGVRVGVSTVRALSLALNIKAVGISSLQAIAYEAQEINNQPVIVVIDAGRDLLYRQDYLKNQQPITPPFLQSIDEFIKDDRQGCLLAGPFAEHLVEKFSLDKNIIIKNNVADVGSFARLAENITTTERPKPLYLRDADAKPQQNFALARK